MNLGWPLGRQRLTVCEIPKGLGIPIADPSDLVHVGCVPCETMFTSSKPAPFKGLCQLSDAITKVVRSDVSHAALNAPEYSALEGVRSLLNV